MNVERTMNAAPLVSNPIMAIQSRCSAWASIENRAAAPESQPNPEPHTMRRCTHGGNLWCAVRDRRRMRSRWGRTEPTAGQG
jgi:hypothetical protein